MADGIDLPDGGVTVQENLIYGNTNGIVGGCCGANLITQNNIYNNSGAGIIAFNADAITQNVIDANGSGVLGESGICIDSIVPFSGVIQNNLIYGNASVGISIQGGYGARILDNTVYQPTGDAVDIGDGPSGAVIASAYIQVRDNILYVQNGYDLNVATDSQTGFQSDYNLRWTTSNIISGKNTDTGKVSLWQGVSGASLTAWYYTSYNDRHSLTGNPNFVNAGSDFHLLTPNGYNQGGLLAPTRNPATGLPQGAERHDGAQRRRAAVFGDRRRRTRRPVQQRAGPRRQLREPGRLRQHRPGVAEPAPLPDGDRSGRRRDLPADPAVHHHLANRQLQHDGQPQHGQHRPGAGHDGDAHRAGRGQHRLLRLAPQLGPHAFRQRPASGSPAPTRASSARCRIHSRSPRSFTIITWP